MSQPTGSTPAYTPPHLEATLLQKQAHVGDQVTYRISVTHPDDVSVKLPAKPDLKPYSLNGVDHQVHQSRKHPKTVTDVWSLRLGVYDLSAKPVPSLTLDVVTPDGPAHLTLPTQALKLESLMPAQGKPTPQELAPPEKVWVPDYTLVEVASVALVATVLALLLWRFWRRRRGRPGKAAPPPPPQPPEVRAREALEALRARNLVAQGRYKAFFFGVSEIVRGYLGERFGFDALECTTTELIARLRDRPTPGLDLARFEAWTATADLVKFADHRPDDPECQAALTGAFEIVDRTTAAHEAARAAADARAGAGPAAA